MTLFNMSELECCSGNLVILGLVVIAVGQKKVFQTLQCSLGSCSVVGQHVH